MAALKYCDECGRYFPTVNQKHILTHGNFEFLFQGRKGREGYVCKSAKRGIFIGTDCNFGQKILRFTDPMIFADKRVYWYLSVDSGVFEDNTDL